MGLWAASPHAICQNGSVVCIRTERVYCYTVIRSVQFRSFAIVNN